MKAQSMLRALLTAHLELGEADVESAVGAGVHDGQAWAGLLVPRDGETESLDPPLQGSRLDEVGGTTTAIPAGDLRDMTCPLRARGEALGAFGTAVPEQVSEGAAGLARGAQAAPDGSEASSESSSAMPISPGGRSASTLSSHQSGAPPSSISPER